MDLHNVINPTDEASEAGRKRKLEEMEKEMDRELDLALGFLDSDSDREVYYIAIVMFCRLVMLDLLATYFLEFMTIFPKGLFCFFRRGMRNRNQKSHLHNM